MPGRESMANLLLQITELCFDRMFRSKYQENKRQMGDRELKMSSAVMQGSEGKCVIRFEAWGRKISPCFWRKIICFTKLDCWKHKVIFFFSLKSSFSEQHPRKYISRQVVICQVEDYVFVTYLPSTASVSVACRPSAVSVFSILVLLSRRRFRLIRKI